MCQGENVAGEQITAENAEDAERGLKAGDGESSWLIARSRTGEVRGSWLVGTRGLPQRTRRTQRGRNCTGNVGAHGYAPSVPLF